MEKTSEFIRTVAQTRGKVPDGLIIDQCIDMFEELGSTYKNISMYMYENAERDKRVVQHVVKNTVMAGATIPSLERVLMDKTMKILLDLGFDGDEILAYCEDIRM